MQTPYFPRRENTAQSPLFKDPIVPFLQCVRDDPMVWRGRYTCPPSLSTELSFFQRGLARAIKAESRTAVVRVSARAGRQFQWCFPQGSGTGLRHVHGGRFLIKALLKERRGGVPGFRVDLWGLAG